MSKLSWLSDQGYQVLLDRLQDGIFVVEEGKLTYVNKRLADMLEYPPGEIIGRPFIDMIAPEDRSIVVERHDARLAGKKVPENYDMRILTAKGKEIFCSINVGLGENKVGGAVTVGSIRDISERKQLEEALKESELCYRTVADYTSDWEYWIMPDNTFRYVSPSCEKISGYTPDEFYADPLLLGRIIHQDDLPIYTGHRHQISAQGESEPVDFRIRTKSGETRWLSHVCRPIYDSSGKHIGQRASNRNISDRKAAEEKIYNLAFYDSLTHLPNRRLLNDRLGQTMAAGKRSGRYSALIFLDLDNFKPLNDKYGHGVGDLLLAEVAKRLSDCVREADTVARFGGDEFVVVLNELDTDKTESAAQAGIVAEKIRVALAEPYLLGILREDRTKFTVEHHCTSSVGVVLFLNHETSPEDIIKWADMAMYQAKQEGRNLIRFFDSQGSIGNHDAKMLRLNWHDSYNSGNLTIDLEHRKLFDLANKLMDAAFERDKNPRGFDSAMDTLLLHVVHHFASEEVILAQNNYADFDSHVRAHNALIEHALQLRDRATAGNLTIGDLVNFIANEVVAQHMLKIDRKFYSLFK